MIDRNINVVSNAEPVALHIGHQLKNLRFDAAVTVDSHPTKVTSLRENYNNIVIYNSEQE